MDTVPANFHDARKTRAFYAVLLCAVGLLINIAGVWIARKTGVPLYIDNIGSALAAALGGARRGLRKTGITLLKSRGVCWLSSLSFR